MIVGRCSLIVAAWCRGAACWPTALWPTKFRRCLGCNGEWAARGQFEPFALIDVDPLEPAAANIVRAGRELVYPDAYPRTRERIERAGFRVRTVDVSELAKAEGAVTCCSLIFDAVR